MSINKVLSIQVESKKNSTSVGGDTFANLVQKIRHESSDEITSNVLILHDNSNNNTNNNKTNLSVCSESPTNLNLSNINDNNNNVNNKSNDESKETLFQKELRFDKNKKQIKKEKPTKYHITFIDKIPPFLPLATIINIKSYKKSSLYNYSFSENDNNNNSNQKSSKNKCCLII